MKKLTILFVALAFATGAMSAPFSDVPRTHWAYDAIQGAVNAGILQGYDGKFHGKRLLNRYQMAVITDKILKAGKGVVKHAAADGDLRKMIANLEALTIEFADELALLNVKVSTLEDQIADIKTNKKCGPCKPVRGGHSGPIGITGFGSFALVNTAEGVQTAGYTQHTRWANDTTYFTLPQISLGFDKEVNEGVFFHAQFDHGSDVNNAGGVNINEAYFLVDELFGDVGAKMGAFALPFSQEHNGPFRTCNYTITASAANNMFEGIRNYGLEIQKTKDVQPEDIMWKFAIVSGTDAGNVNGLFNDAPVNVTAAAEGDEGFGFYLMVGKKPVGGKGFGWNLAYFNNGGDADDDTNASTEFTGFNVGLEYAMDDMLFLAQYVDGTRKNPGDADDTDVTTWYFLFNYQIDENQSITLRYDNFEMGDDVMDVTAMTFAYNRKVTDNSMMQFEYISPKEDERANGDEEAEDNLVQLRYKVHF